MSSSAPLTNDLPPTRATPVLVLIARLMLLVVAGALAISAFALGRDEHASHAPAVQQYACPMHPEVVSSAPAECPICRMALEPLKGSPPAASAKSSTSSGPHFVCPMHPEVTAPGPGDCPICRMALAPVLNVARTDSFSLANSGKEASHKVVDTPKRQVFTQEVRAPAWFDSSGVVRAVLYRDELVGLVAGEPGSFFRAKAPLVAIDVRLTAVPAPSDGSTARVDFGVGAAASDLAAGEVGWVQLAAKSRELLVVPVSAVVYSADGPYVLLAAADGHTFSKRPLELGRNYAGHVAVLSGLRDDEPIVVGSTFFLDVERRSQTRLTETSP